MSKLLQRTNTLIITNDCNLRCEYCYIPGRKKTVMSYDVIDKALKILPVEATTYWDIIGGEPLLEIERIDYISEKLKDRDERHILNITTNGTLFWDPVVRQILEKYRKKKSVGLSLDGPKYVHDMNRCGSFDRVMEYFDWWKRTFPWCATKSTVNKKTLPYLAESVRFLVSLGLKYIPINIIYEEEWDEKDQNIYREQLNLISDFLIETGFYKEVKVSMFEEMFASPVHEKKNWCGSGEHMIAVGPDGSLFPCNRFADLDLPRIGTLDDGIDQDRLYPFKASHQKIDNCGNCSIMGACPGCLAFDYQKTGSIFKRALNNCNMHKVLIAVNKEHWNKINSKMGA